MLFSEKAMANIGNDEAAKRAKISALVASLLKDHREALHFIPDIFEQFNALQSNEHKSTLIERENKDLKQKVESLSYDIEVKNQRIVALGQKIEAMEFIGQQSFSGERIAALGKQLEATTFTNQQSFTADRILMLEKKLEAAKVDEERKRELISSLERKLETMKSTKDLLEKRSPDTQAQERSIQAMKDRNDQLIRTIEEQYINLKENDQKYEEMKRELNIKDQKLKEKEDKFLLLEKEYNSTIQDKDSDIKQMKLRYDELNHVLNTKDQELKDEKEKFQQLQKEYNSIIHNKDSDIEQMKFRINELERGANSALRCKDREIEQLKSRIASISEKKVRQDQSTVENTLSMNRQSKLEDDFKLFVDEARVDACDRIQSFCNSNEESFVRIYYPRLACLIFEAAFEQTKQAKQAFEEICKDVSKGLIHSAPGLIQIFFSYKQKRYSSYPITFTVNTSRQEMQYPTDVVDAFLLSLKESAIAHDMAFCVVDVQNTVWQKWRAWFQEDRCCKLKPDENILRDPQILSYIKKCLQLTWRMVTQVPAMTLEYQSNYLNNDLHTVLLHRSSPATFNNTASGKQEIAFYIWPGFRDGRGTVIRRGDVICKVAK